MNSYWFPGNFGGYPPSFYPNDFEQTLYRAPNWSPRHHSRQSANESNRHRSNRAHNSSYRYQPMRNQPIWTPNWNQPMWTPNWNQPMWNQPMWNQPMWNQPMWNQPMWNQPMWNQPMRNQSIWNEPMWNQSWNNGFWNQHMWAPNWNPSTRSPQQWTSQPITTMHRPWNPRPPPMWHQDWSSRRHETMRQNNRRNHPLQVDYELTSPYSVVPTVFDDESPGIDFYYPNSGIGILLQPGEQAIINTHVVMKIPQDMIGVIMDKSSVVTQQDLKVEGGLIDTGYRGEIKIVLRNMSDEQRDISPGQAIAQMVLHKAHHVKLNKVDKIDAETNRGTRGFGTEQTVEREPPIVKTKKQHEEENEQHEKVKDEHEEVKDEHEKRKGQAERKGQEEEIGNLKILSCEIA